jgi:TolB-like protein/Tfp pilus assembly protein PilF
VNPRKFFAELKRRNVYKVAIAYAVVAWLLMQVASQIFPFFDIPNWAVRLVVLLLGIGFPIALIIAWAFELTPEGLKRTEFADELPKKSARNRAWIYVVVIGSLISIGLFFLGRYTARPAAHGAAGSPTARAKSIAVLPFESRSEDKTNVYFADGIQDELLTRLSKISDLKVISRTSTQHYKSAPENLPEIAKKLGVANILEGSVQKAGEQVRVNVQLIHAQSDSHLWAETYDRRLTDIFQVESEIAKRIADTLEAKLTGDEQHALSSRPTENPEAHQFYLKGRFYWNKRTDEGVRKGIEYFQQAIEKDPTYALAYTGIADCYSLEGLHIDVGSLSPSEAIPKAKAAAMKALEMDDTLAEAHTSLAFIRLNYDWDFPGAEREFKQGIELNQNSANAHHWYSHYFMAMGRIEESLAESKRALELDPLGLIMNTHLGWHYMNAHQYDLAIDQFRKTLEMDANYGLAHWYLGLAYEQKAMYAEAAAELRKAKDLLKENVAVAADMGHNYAVSGKRDEAQKVVDELTELSKLRYVSSYHIALIYTGLGEKDRAFEWLENAYKERSDLLVYLKVDPRLDSLRSDPRFQDLLRRVGLTP